MEKFENRLYEIGKMMVQPRQNHFVASIGHRVYDISLLLNKYQGK